MKEENPVYVKLEYEEALQSKRDILESQAGLLRLLQMIRDYKFLRMEELKLKAKAYRKIKELAINLKKIKTNLPLIKIPQIKKGKDEDEFKEKIKSVQEKNYDDSLEIQLQEIQNRLREIGG